MITVIIAGGSGTRLWPLSTNNYPKHLLKLTNHRSMLQNTYDRAKRLGENVYVVTEASHSDHVEQQLPDLSKDSFIIEPGRRGTASCIVAALDVISRSHDKDKPVAFLSADHHIRDIDGFAHSFAVAAHASTRQGAIALVGVEPTYPSTGFGYIEKESLLSEESNVYSVACFKEKPQFDIAQEYVASGHYLWNCGYFVGSVNTFLGAMQKSAPQLFANYEKLQAIADTSSEDYRRTYLEFENEAIDYALIEKVEPLLAVPATFDWMDVGSFKDLHEANESDESKNHLAGESIHLDGVENAYIRDEEGKSIAVIGLDNIVVVNTKHGVLVARKDLSQRVGDIAKKVQKQQAP